jgi:CRP/FNR family transcriptional regulator, cyclic AMP receptor protein
MLKRFEGDNGRRLLIEQIKSQRIVGGDDAIATAFAAAAHVEERKVGDVLIQQGDGSNNLILILSGTVGVMVNGRGVATRRAGEHVGEMSLVDPSAPRSATVTVLDDAIVAQVGEADFSRIVGDHPTWRRLAKELCQRLRARGEMLRQPNDKPRLFLGSSAEALPVIKAIQAGLAYENVVATTWGDGVFTAGSFTLETLEAEVQNADFALMAFTPDDTTLSRNKQLESPRDNVVFELGLFMGALGRKRTLIAQERGAELKIPSDLRGLTTLLYQPGKPEDMRSRVGALCTDLAESMKKLGVR